MGQGGDDVDCHLAGSGYVPSGDGDLVLAFAPIGMRLLGNTIVTDQGAHANGALICSIDGAQ